SGQPQGLWVADLAAATPHEAVQASTSSSGSAARSSGDRRTALRRRFGAPARRSLSTNEARKRLCPGSSPGPITSAQRVPEGTYEGDEGPARGLLEPHLLVLAALRVQEQRDEGDLEDQRQHRCAAEGIVVAVDQCGEHERHERAHDGEVVGPPALVGD